MVGGVAIGGDSDLPEGHAGFMDKLVGKTQKVSPFLSFSIVVRAQRNR